MVKNSLGAEKGRHKEVPLQPGLLEDNDKGNDGNDTRLKVMKFKRNNEMTNAATDGSSALKNEPFENERTSPSRHLKVVEPVSLASPVDESDIYFTKEYVKVNELIEAGEAKFFEIKSKNGHITHSAIKRQIHTTIDGEQYFDLISPYGYGGPVIHDYTNREKLISDFKDCFSIYCANNNIVSEFIRFHPLFQNQEDMAGIYDSFYLRETVGTDLKRFDDVFQSEFSSSARRIIRKILKDKRLSYTVHFGLDNVEDFLDIYNTTMNRNGASHFYYFNKEYFYALKDKMRNNLMTISVHLDGQIITMGLYFLSAKTIHEHLIGTKPEYLKFSSAYLLKYAAMQWGKENGYDLIHYGGGLSNADDDPLFLFKKRFGKETAFKFHIGRKIWNDEVYDKLCVERGMDKNRDFFPAYR